MILHLEETVIRVNKKQVAACIMWNLLFKVQNIAEL